MVGINQLRLVSTQPRVAQARTLDAWSISQRRISVGAVRSTRRGVRGLPGLTHRRPSRFRGN